MSELAWNKVRSSNTTGSAPVQVCKHCQVPLEGSRELDEEHGDECLTCMIGALASRIRRIESFLVLD